MTKNREEQYFVDLHVHIGRTEENLPVKVTASRDLTFSNIAHECLMRKGIDIVGIVDCASPYVIRDIEKMLNSGEMCELRDGGLRYQDRVTIILGSEIETKEDNSGLSHQIAYFPYFSDIRQFSIKISKLVTNPNLSSQNSGITAQEFHDLTDSSGGIAIPAHVFTPYKSIFGSCTAHLAEIFNPLTLQKIPAIELGLSADTYLADCLPELNRFTFLTNSDAHSLPKIGREYNIIRMEQPTFKELLMALKKESGRAVIANYGLDPKLGKYHRTHCEECSYTATAANLPPVLFCGKCGSNRITKGVLDRIIEISGNCESRSPSHRPPYYHQIPLEFVPGIGRKTKETLFNQLGTEMNVLHHTDFATLSKVVGSKIAYDIILAHKGELILQSGGGGKYGKVKKDNLRKI